MSMRVWMTMAMRAIWVALATLTMCTCTTLPPVQALQNGLGLTPPMGWNSWDLYGCNVNEANMRNVADALVQLGLADAGYMYVNVDDCWASSRDNSSRIVADTTAFPSGMFALGDYIHSQGLRFGLLSSAGNVTCSGRPGSLNYEAIDAISFAAWGVDFLKYTDCGTYNLNPAQLYPVMGAALNWTGRPIFYSMDDSGESDPATWAAPFLNSWRTEKSMGCSWSDVTYNIDMNNRWVGYGGPGQWNDADVLVVGGGCLTHDEEVTHFSWWALVKSPLLLSADLSSISPQSLAVLLNSEVIAVNQDPLGVQGQKFTSVNGAEVWGGALVDGAYAVMLVNRLDNDTIAVTANFTQFGFDATQQLIVRDLWRHKNVGIYTGNITAKLAPHASMMLKLTPTPPDSSAASENAEDAEDADVADVDPYAFAMI